MGRLIPERSTSFDAIEAALNPGGSGKSSEPAVTGITAGTTRTQAGAFALAAGINRVDTSTAPAVGSLLGDGVILPAAATGLSVTLINNTNNPIQVYGNGTDTLNAVSGATGLAVPANCFEIIKAAAPGGWNFDAGVGFAGALSTLLAAGGLTATGSNQAGALALPADLNRISTAPAGTGVRLPPAVPGLDVFILNHGANSLQVYGAGTDTIDDIATATGVTQMTNSVVLFTCYEIGKFYSNGLASGFSPTGLQTLQFADPITAAGTTQATATPLNALLNNIATVGAGTGVNLPQSASGLQILVMNNGLNPLQVYPLQGAADTINGVAAGNGVQQQTGTAATYNCTTTGVWTVAALSPVNSAYRTRADTAGFTATGANIAGGQALTALDLTGTLVGGAALTLPAVAALVLAMHSPAVGQSYMLRVINRSAGPFNWTVTTNTGWTLNGSMAVAQNTWRDFVITLNSLTAATAQTVGTGTAP